MKLSVVVTTRNEAANIGNCLRSFDAVKNDVELIVVDNSSSDCTKEIAAGLGAKVFDKGPERCAQRNFGWKNSSSEWILVLDADMMLPQATVDEIFSIVNAGDSAADAYWIPERRVGESLRIKARNFERSFYDGTAVDALRLFRRKVLDGTGGYDESLIAGGEDWELDIRALALGIRCEVMENHLIHNEQSLSFLKMLRKKSYYSKTMDQYRRKWSGHPALSKQFGLRYRFFEVFFEKGKWKKLLKHPVLASVMYFERIAVGIVYLFSR